ncbi:MAG: lysine N(6)-hydroxylase/L-ornithine N(5)-oxygenase family protein [Verrucomicrobia bacterium]|jgi:hypothetical protein|nr:lysine N(6)-hydroxylase/L-ornithine N(5)-oxygenase family protein [Verrucomicrobiota bacterium]
MLSSHEIIAFMTPALATEILTWAYEGEKPLYKATLAAVAEARKVRAVFLERQPRSQRHAGMIEMLAKSRMEAAASTLLRTWLLKGRKSLLVDFLDALGVEHEDGVVDDLPPSMDEARLKEAVDKVLQKHPHEVVAVYLNAFNGMNETGWPALKTLLESDQRLQLGAAA